VPPTSHPFGNFHSVIHVEQLSASTMILEEAQFTEILASQNGLNQPGVANLPIHFVLGVSGQVTNYIITHDT